MEIKEDKHCSYIMPDGSRCGAYRQKDSSCCYLHDPDKVTERSLATKQGGQESIKSTDLEVIDGKRIRITRPKDIRLTLVRIMNLLRERRITPNEANAMCYACSQILRGLELVDIDARLSELEKLIQEQDAIQY